MVQLLRCAILMLLLAGSVPGVLAASRAETQAFGRGRDAFEKRLYWRAEQLLDEFVRKYPESTFRAEAILYQAQARLADGKPAAAIELLSANQAGAGEWTDRYLYCIGEAQLLNTNRAAAANAFAEIRARFPNSPRLLDACVREASARALLQEPARVIGLLGDKTGAFQKAIQSGTTNQLIAAGYLLLGEAHLERKQFSETAAVLKSLAGQDLPPEHAWRRQYLEARLRLAEGNPAAARSEGEPLTKLAEAANSREFQAESVAFQAGVLERLNLPDESAALWARNIATNVPIAHQRQALMQMTRIQLAGNKESVAMDTLKAFLDQHPAAEAADMARLTLGELYLKRYDAALEANAGESSAVASNFLRQAAVQFDALLATFTNSPLAGKALAGRGWCLWLEERFAESREAFREAVARLPNSRDQAVARFKWADAQFRLSDFAGAIANYRELTSRPDTPGIGDLLEPALYQTVRAGIEAGDMDAATNALQRILEFYPDGFAGDRGLLLVGEGLARRKDTARARQLFADFEERYPTNALLPEVRLAVARSYDEEQNWEMAIKEYVAWTNRFAADPALPRALFSLAWDYSLAGQDTNALALFGEVVARFPNYALAPRAQMWIADYYFSKGKNQEAEDNYQLVFATTNWPASELTYRARMMAGRAAEKRESYGDAIGYYTNLMNQVWNVPAAREVYVQALFAYGDAQMNVDSTNRFREWSVAKDIFTVLATNYPAHELAPAAMGKVGDCYFQMAIADPQRFYPLASNAYQQIISMSNATVSARSQAKVGLANIAEKQALLTTNAVEHDALLSIALDHCLDLLPAQAELREGERPDPFWVKKAGLKAVQLARQLKRWDNVITICEELQTLLPTVSLDKEIVEAQRRKAEM